MKLKIKFANKEVNIKKLTQGAVVLCQHEGESGINAYHIRKFDAYNEADNTLDLVISDEFGKWTKNSADLTWPI